jgi:hypothetical protein
MTEDLVRLSTFVAGGHVIEVRQDRSGSACSMIVSVELDGQRSWLFDEPSWQDLSYGVSDSGTAYWWSARHLVVLPTGKPHGDPLVVSTDEDIRLAFSVAEGWLLVCETSVRLLAEGIEVSRIEAGDVLLSAHWEGPYLVVSDADGSDLKIRTVDGRLVLARKSF